MLAAEGVRDTTGLDSWGIGPRATVSPTLSEAFWRMPMACWWVTFLSSGWPLMARIWSASRSFPSLREDTERSRAPADNHGGRVVSPHVPVSHASWLDLLDEDAQLAVVLALQADHAEAQTPRLRLLQLHVRHVAPLEHTAAQYSIKAGGSLQKSI